MEHDGQDGQPFRSSERASQSELRLDSLSGPPQVLLIVAVHLCMKSAHTYIITSREKGGALFNSRHTSTCYSSECMAPDPLTLQRGCCGCEFAGDLCPKVDTSL